MTSSSGWSSADTVTRMETWTLIIISAAWCAWTPCVVSAASPLLLLRPSCVESLKSVKLQDYLFCSSLCGSFYYLDDSEAMMGLHIHFRPKVTFLLVWKVGWVNLAGRLLNSAEFAVWQEGLRTESVLILSLPKWPLFSAIAALWVLALGCVFQWLPLEPCSHPSMCCTSWDSIWSKRVALIHRPQYSTCEPPSWMVCVEL